MTNRTHIPTLLLIAVFGASAQEPSDLQIDRGIDKEISALKDLPAQDQPRVVAELAGRIAQRPNRNIAVLATNLAVSVGEGGPFERETLQLVASTLADALRKSPQEKTDLAYPTLAAMARYDHVQVSLDDPGFTAAIAALAATEQRVSKADFTLTDLKGRKWRLKSLRGKVVMVNFWASWCPPCVRELPELASLYSRYHGRGLVILFITDEELSALQSRLPDLKLPYPILRDPNRTVHERFGVRGIPKTFIYNRAGVLAAQTNDAPTLKGFSDMLGQAGLR